MSQNSEVRAAISRLTRFLQEEDRDAAATFFANAEADASNPDLDGLERAVRDRLNEALAGGGLTAEVSIARMAAQSDEEPNKELAAHGLVIEGVTFLVFEDEYAVVHLRGPIPDAATHLRIDTGVYSIERLAPDEVTAPDLTPAVLEAFYEKTLALAALTVSWVRR